MNTDESELTLFRAERRVREIQAKLHRWADHDPQRDLWSARCPETGTAGAGGGSGKPTGGNTGRAPRADLTARACCGYVLGDRTWPQAARIARVGSP